MESNDLQRHGVDEPEPPSPEVGFALVLVRMIDSVKDDPEQLRHAIYDLARYKLQEQFANVDAAGIQNSKKALESAIRGVEAFSRKGEQANDLPQRPGIGRTVSPTMVDPPVKLISGPSPSRMPRDQPVLEVTPSVKRNRQWPRLGRALGLIAVLFGIAVVVQQRENLPSFRSASKASGTAVPVKPEVQSPPETTTQLPSAASTKLSLPLPTNFGVYAITDDRLVELSLLPGRAQDLRVAISPAIGTPSQSLLPSGRVKFIVFRREAASNIPDRAEVRIIAKITRAMSYDASGKPIIAASDSWVIRNISFPYRTAPVKDNSEMYEIQAEDPGSELSPGRYALVLKGQVFDFSIDGATADPRHCLERVTAANGTFVSECRNH